MKARSFQTLIRMAAMRGFFAILLPLIMILPAHPQDNHLAPFYDDLIRMSDWPLDRQIDSLSAVISRSAPAERCYDHLLQLIQMNGDGQAALAFFQRLASQPAHRITAERIVGEIYLNRADYQKASEHFLRALGNRPHAGQLILQLATFNSQKPDSIATLPVSDYLDAAEMTLYRFYLAAAASSKPAYAEAVPLAGQLSTARYRQMKVLDILGVTLKKLRRQPEAKAVWEEGAAIARVSGDRKYMIRFATRLNTTEEFEAYSDNIDQLDSLLREAQRIADFEEQQFILGYMANVYKRSDQLPQAIALFGRAAFIASRIAPPGRVANLTWFEAKSLYIAGDYAAALKAYTLCETFARRAGNRARLVSARLSIGELYLYLDQTALAREAFEEVSRLATKWRLESYRYRAMESMADIYADERRFSEAQTLYRRFLNEQSTNLSIEDQLVVNGKLADTYLEEGNTRLAEKGYLRSQELADQIGSEYYRRWYSYKRIKCRLLDDEDGTAIGEMKALIADTDPRQYPELSVEMYAGLGARFRSSDAPDSAIQYYHRSALLLEQARDNIRVPEFRVAYLSKKAHLYHELGACYFQKYRQDQSPADLDSLFGYAEKARARVLKDYQFNVANDRLTGVDTVTYRRYRHACSELQRTQRQLRKREKPLRTVSEADSLSKRVALLQNSLLQQRFQLATDQRSGQTAEQAHNLSTVVEVVQQFDADLIFYITNDATMCALVVSGGQPYLVTLDTDVRTLSDRVHQLVSPFHQSDSLGLAAVPFHADIAHALYESLIAPIESRFTLKNRLLIVPDIALMRLPFAMLLRNAPAQSVYYPADEPVYAGDLLMNDYNFLYSPSATLLERELSAPAAAPRVLVIANPDFYGESTVLADRRGDLDAGQQQDADATRPLRRGKGWRFNPLPNTAQEARKIQAHYGRTEIIDGRNATKSAFFRQAPHFQVIHIATHGFADLSYDYFSGLALSLGEDGHDDGLLMGYEIADMRLPDCDLVTLSACETGRGRLVAGEGVLGLPRLFLGAGARAVLMSHWKVDDRFTSLLMPEFYRQLLTFGRSRADALAAAKRAVYTGRNRDGLHYQHPVFWAPFALFGDPGRVAAPGETSIVGMIISGTAFLALLAGLLWWRRRRRQPGRLS